MLRYDIKNLHKITERKIRKNAYIYVYIYIYIYIYKFNIVWNCT